jgi:Aldo/keto reductase family
MSPANQPHILLGSGGGIIPSSTPQEVAAIFKHLKGLASVIYGIDTAAVYGGGGERGKSERVLGEAGIADAGLVIDTKVLFYGPDGPGDGREKDGGPLSRVNVLRSSKESLERLKVGKVRCLYAHQVDRNTPIAETVGAFGEVLKAGEAEVVSAHPPAIKLKVTLDSGGCQTFHLRKSRELSRNARSKTYPNRRSIKGCIMPSAATWKRSSSPS